MLRTSNYLLAARLPISTFLNKARTKLTCSKNNIECSVKKTVAATTQLLEDTKQRASLASTRTCLEINQILEDANRDFTDINTRIFQRTLEKMNAYRDKREPPLQKGEKPENQIHNETFNRVMDLSDLDRNFSRIYPLLDKLTEQERFQVALKEIKKLDSGISETREFLRYRFQNYNITSPNYITEIRELLRTKCSISIDDLLPKSR
jgi:hypothetical protein